MARMTASKPTVRIRSDEWLPEEWIEIRTYQGEKLRGAIEDAVVEVAKPDVGESKIVPTPNRAILLKLHGHIVNWCLFEETEPGVKGPAIAFSDEAIDDLDPSYARYAIREINKHVAVWRRVTKGGEAPEAQKTFQQDPVGSPK